jgi:hypothetical protein
LPVSHGCCQGGLLGIDARAVWMIWPRVRRGRVGMALGRDGGKLLTDPLGWLVGFALFAGGSRVLVSRASRAKGEGHA